MRSIVVVIGFITIFIVAAMLSTPAYSSGFLPIATPASSTTPSAETLVEQARLLNRAERPTAALLLLDQVIIEAESDDVSLYRAYFQRGQIYQEQGSYELAIRDYTQAIELQPNLSEVYAFRAAAYFLINELDDAIADYDAAIANDESEPNYYIARGIIRARQEDYDAAIDDFSLALAFDTDSAVAYRERGLAAYATGQVSLATTDLQQYLLLAPEAPDRQQIESILEDLE